VEDPATGGEERAYAGLLAGPALPLRVYSEDLVRAAFASALPRWNRIE
jgi:hypothetical protein